MRRDIVKLLRFWSSATIAVLGAAYLLLLIYYFSTQGFVFPPTPVVQFIGGIVTFFTVPGLVVLFSAIRYTHEDANRILGALGVSFITLFAATVSINRFVQLTVIQQSAPGSASQDLARFLPYSTGSVMFALEMLGWGFFSSLAALCAAPLFYGSRLNVSIRWLFIAYTLFSFMSVVGYATQTPITAGAFVAWVPSYWRFPPCWRFISDEILKIGGDMEHNLQPALREDIEVVLNWIATPEQLRFWGGPALSYPPRVDAIWEEMGATVENTFSLISPERQVVGLGQVLLREEDTAHMARIIVSPALRGNGIGRILCQGLIRVGVRSYGANRLTLNVYKDNLPAVRLYRALGFKIVAEDTEQNWFRMHLHAHALPGL